MRDNTPGTIFSEILQQGTPQAIAWINGNAQNPQLSGVMKFYETPYEGVLIEVEVFGLPNFRITKSSNFYAIHIHNYGDCGQGFSQTGEHYSPIPTAHPHHKGDLIPLLGNQGYAWDSFYDKRFTISEIIGRSVIIHSGPDDFTSQPSGNSGIKIGCGVIRYI